MEKNPQLIRVVQFGQPYYYNCLWCNKPLMRPAERESGFCCLWCESNHSVAIADNEPVEVQVV